MLIKSASKNHHLLGGFPDDSLEKSAQYFWHQWCLTPCTHATIAYHKGKIIGFFRYYFSGKQLNAYGTWVTKSYRRKGLAFRLWKAAIVKEKPISISVNTTSRGGSSLVRSIEKQFTKIKVKEYRCYL